MQRSNPRLIIAFFDAFQSDRRLRASVLAGVFFFFLFARRSAQLLYPQVWDEEHLIIEDIVRSGPLAIAHPLNGYLIVSSKLIGFISLLFPLQAYAFLSTLLVWAFIIGVLLAIALAPTTLMGGPLLAIAVLLVPSNPEVIGIPLYSFWFAALLALVTVFWQPGESHQRLRNAFTVIAGLSSPFIVLVAPVAVVRALRERTRSEYFSAATFTGCALLQGIIALRTADNSGSKGLSVFTSLLAALPKFVGTYSIGNIWVHASIVRASMLVLFALIPFVLIVLTLRSDRSQRATIFSLTYLWIGSILLSCVRQDPNVLDPNIAGPRYFFYPYLLESWILIQLAFAVTSETVRRTVAVMLAITALNVLPVLNRSHDDLTWKDAVANCEADPGQGIHVTPIQLAGSAAQTWPLYLTPSQCRRLGRFGLAGLAFPN